MSPTELSIDIDEERAIVVRALHAEADKLDDEAILLDSMSRRIDGDRSRMRARFLRLAAVFLLRDARPQ
jgi:hypothetical protein